MRACAQISPAPHRSPAAPRFCPIVLAGAGSQCGFSCLRGGVTFSHVGPIVRVIEGDPGASRCGRCFSRGTARGARRPMSPPEPARPRERSLVSGTVCQGPAETVLPSSSASSQATGRRTVACTTVCGWQCPWSPESIPPTPARVPQLSPLLVSLSRATPMFQSHLVGPAARGPPQAC